MSHRYRLRWLLIGGPLILAVVLALLWVRAGQYTEVAVRRGNMIEAVYGLGRVMADQKYEIRLALMASVEALYVREGEAVAAGTPLIKFRETPVFRAPFAGTITAVQYRSDEIVMPQGVVLQLQNLKDRYIEVPLEQQGALRVAEGQPVNIVVESVQGKKWTGVVSALFPHNDLFLAHIRVDDLPGNILPGMTADVVIAVQEHRNVMLVPVAAIQGGTMVVKRAGRRLKIPVTVGSVKENDAAILGGDLRDTDRILVER
ncbi:MAG: efflux RND transporter periplasmic adaptor subunit [Deltaproteobacteria bacterium]|nr:efflux RND transporter periplasmic adaptor subunit [Deltaproteobacteria bacterium]